MMNQTPMLGTAIPIESASGFDLLAILPPLLMAVGVILLGVLVALMLKNRREPAVKLAALEGESPEWDSARHQIDEAHSRAASLIATAQRMSTRLDEKIARAELLLTRLDEQARRLHEERAEPPPQIETLAPREPAALEPSAIAAETPPALRSSIENKPSLDPLTRAVYDLADEGRDAVEIARALDEQIGKVELILALRR